MDKFLTSFINDLGPNISVKVDKWMDLTIIIDALNSDTYIKLYTDYNTSHSAITCFERKILRIYNEHRPNLVFDKRFVVKKLEHNEPHRIYPIITQGYFADDIIDQCHITLHFHMGF